MIQDQTAEILIIAKYILIALAIIGVVILAFGIHRGNRGLIERGAYIVILSIVVGICGYVIYDKTKQRMEERLQNTYISY